MRRDQNCDHDWILAGSTFGADHGAMCRKCWAEGSDAIYKKLKRASLERQLAEL